MDKKEKLHQNNRRDLRIAHRKHRWSNRLRDADLAASGTGADATQAVSAAARHHAQALEHVAGVLLSYDAENDAVLVKVEGAHFQQAATLASLLQDMQADVQTIQISQAAEKAATDACIAELMQLVDPQRLAAAMASLSEAIRASSQAADKLIRRSEDTLLVWHGRYLAALAAQEETHDSLAVTEQLVQLQGACSRQLAALDTLHTQEEQAGLAADQANIARLCDDWQQAETQYGDEQLKTLVERQGELQQLRAEFAEQCRSLRTRLDSEVNQLEGACASARAGNLIEAETLRLAHERLLLLGPDQLREVQAHGLRLAHAQRLLATLKRKHFEMEQVFAKDNATLGREYQAVSTKLRELQAREVALHAAASVRAQEVRQIKDTELSTLEQQLQNTIREVSSMLHSGIGQANRDATGFGNEHLAAVSDPNILLAGSKRSWLLLEKVLARTCAAWQSVDADEQQLARFQQQHSALEARTPEVR